KEVDGKVAKILTEEQKKQLSETPMFGPGGFRGFPQPGQIMSPARQDQLQLTADQNKQMQDLQKETDPKLEKILTKDQNKQLADMRQGFGRGGPGGRGGFGRFGPGGFRGGKPPNATYRWEVYCLDRATGNVLWKQTA